MSDSNSTRSCCISSSSSCPTPDSSESSWWLLGVLTRLCPGIPPAGTLPGEFKFGPPLVLLLLLPIPLEPLPELGLRKLVLSKKQTEHSMFNFHVANAEPKINWHIGTNNSQCYVGILGFLSQLSFIKGYFAIKILTRNWFVLVLVSI